MSQLGSFIGKMERLKTAYNVRPFYITHAGEWREQARQIAVAILQNARPADTDAAVWRARVAAESERLSSLLFFSEEEVGVVLSMGTDPAAEQSTDPKTYQLHGVSVDEVERWVAAGRSKSSPEEPGKNLDERDANKSDRQIAWRLIWSMKLRKEGWERLLGHIQTFLGGSESDAAQALYGAILHAWLTQLAPRIRADFAAWFHRQTLTALRG